MAASNFGNTQDDGFIFDTGTHNIQRSTDKKSKWRKRHPVIFWFLLVLLALFIFNVLSSVFVYLDEKGIFSGPRLGIIRVEGPINDSKAVVEWANHLRRNENVHGVLLHVNSPGGSVVPSQEIYAAIRRLAEVKPVVVYMGSSAASGGYYVAIAGDYIFASPSSITGSIGVRMELADIHKLMDFIGIKEQVLVTGPYKSAGTSSRPMTEEERHYLQGMIQDMHESFVETVAKERKMSIDEARSLADGRAYTGRQALKFGLIDQIGDMEDALQLLAERCKITDLPEYLDGPQKKQSFLQEFLGEMMHILVREVASANKSSQISGFYY